MCRISATCECIELERKKRRPREGVPSLGKLCARQLISMHLQEDPYLTHEMFMGCIHKQLGVPVECVGEPIVKTLTQEYWTMSEERTRTMECPAFLLACRDIGALQCAHLCIGPWAARCDRLSRSRRHLVRRSVANYGLPSGRLTCLFHSALVAPHLVRRG